MEKKCLECFTKKNCKGQIKQSLKLANLRKKDNYMSNGKAMIICLIATSIKKILNKLSYFLETYTHSKHKMKFELHFYNYAAKSNWKSTTGFNSVKITKKVDLASLKSNIDIIRYQ